MHITTNRTLHIGDEASYDFACKWVNFLIFSYIHKSSFTYFINMAAASNASVFVPRPDKLAADCDIKYNVLPSIRLFLQLAAVPEANQLKVLLAYLDLPVFQATVTALNIKTATYLDIKKLSTDPLFYS